MSLTRREFVRTAAAGLAAAAIAPALRAQSPETGRIIIGFAPGGTIDLVGRRIADKLALSYSLRMLVENRTGAGGQIAVQAVKAAAADGGTILLTPASPLALHPLTFRRLAYDPVADLMPVSGAAKFDYALAAGPMVPAAVRTAQEFLAWARANPAQATFGSAGNGSAAHFIGAALARAGRADLRHAAYRGSQPAILDMVGGQIAAVIGPTGEFMTQVQAGKVRLLGTSGPARGKFTPGVASFAEQGLREVTVIGWFGFYLPARTPQDTVERLNAALRQGLTAQDVADGFATAFLEPMPSTPAQQSALLRNETEFWAGVVKAIGFTPES